LGLSVCKNLPKDGVVDESSYAIKKVLAWPSDSHRIGSKKRSSFAGFGRVTLARSPARIPLAASGGQERSKLAHESDTSLECGFRAHPRSGITSLAGIAAALNARGVRTARDGEWHASTVRNLLAGSTVRILPPPLAEGSCRRGAKCQNQWPSIVGVKIREVVSPPHTVPELLPMRFPAVTMAVLALSLLSSGHINS